MERPAFDRLITATLPKIQQAAQKYAMLYRRFYEWEDIAQQTALLKMLRFADLYDPGKGDLLPWACVIICNTIKTHIAQSMTVPDMVEFNALIIDRTPAADCDPEEYAQMTFLLSNMNEEARLFSDGYNYAEIAARCGFRSQVTAKNRIDKCAESLCRVLGLTVKQQRRQRMYSKASR